MYQLDKRPAYNLPDYKPHLLSGKKAGRAWRGTDEGFNYRQYLRVVESSASPQLIPSSYIMTHRQLLEHFSPTDDENSKQDLHFNSFGWENS